MRLGLISDTHGLMRPEALAALAGVDHILHAGDIGSEAIITALQALAPLSIIRGNNDTAAWAASLPDTLDVELGGIRFHLVHDVKDLRGTRPAADVVVSGHSHKPLVEERDGVLFVNPGSAGPRRFSLPVSVAILEMRGGELKVDISVLEVPRK